MQHYRMESTSLLIIRCADFALESRNTNDSALLMVNYMYIVQYTYSSHKYPTVQYISSVFLNTANSSSGVGFIMASGH